MDYNTEKQMLVDIARASIEANGPFVAETPASIVSLVYFGEKIEEQILDLFIGEDSGQVLVNSAPYCEEERHELTPLEDFSNDEIRAILEAVGISTKKVDILEWENTIRDLVLAKGEEEFTEGTFRFWLGDLNGVCDIAGHTDVLSVLATKDWVNAQVNTPDDDSTIFVNLDELPYKVVKEILNQVKAPIV